MQRHKKKTWISLVLVLALLFSTSAFYAADGADTIGEPQPLQITTTSIPKGTVGIEFHAQLAASGGSGEGYVFSITGGRLQAGLELSEDGTISGTPTQNGSNSIYFTVRDSENHSVRKKLYVRIAGETVNFTVTEDTWQYDGKLHQATVTPSNPKIGEGDFQVFYNGAESQSEVGSYYISVAMRKPGYVVGGVYPQLLQIQPSADCTISMSSATFAYDGNPHTLTYEVSPVELTDNVTLEYEGINGTVYPRSTIAPSEGGQYRVTARMTHPNYTTTTRTATLTITGIPVDFTVDSEAWRDQDDIHYQLPVQSIGCNPSTADLEKTDYTVYLTAEGGQPTDQTISELGTYQISIKIHNPNYQVGEINPGTFELKGYRRVHFRFVDTNKEVDPALAGEGKTPAYSAKTTAYYKGYVDETLTELPFTDDTAYTVYYVPIDESGNPDESKAVAGGVTEEGRYLIDVRINDGQTERYRLGDVEGDSGVDPTSNLPIFTLKFVDRVDFTVTDGSETQEYTGAKEGLTANVQPVSELPEGLRYQVLYQKLSQGEPTGELLNSCVDAGEYNIHLILFDQNDKIVDATFDLPKNVAKSDLSTYRIGNITPKVFTITQKAVDFNVTGTSVWIDIDQEPIVDDGSFGIRSAEISTDEEAVAGNFTVLYTLLSEDGNPTENVYEEGVIYAGTYAISVRLNNENYKAGNFLVNGQAVDTPTFTAKTFRYIDFAVDLDSLTATTDAQTPNVYKAALSPRYVDQSNAADQLTEGVDYQVLYIPTGKVRSADGTATGGVTAPGTYAVSIAFTGENYRFRQFVDGASADAVILDEPVLFTLTVDCTVDFTIAPETAVLYEKGTVVYSVDVTPNLDEIYGLTANDYIVTYTAVKEARATEAAINGVTVPGRYTVRVDLTEEAKAMGFKMGSLLNGDGNVIDAPIFTLLNPAVDLALVKGLNCPLESYILGETLSLDGLEMGLNYAYDQGTQQVLTLEDLKDYIYITAAANDQDQNPVLFSTVDGTVFTEENKQEFIGRTVYVEYTVKTPVAMDNTIEEQDVTFRYTLGTINVSEEPVLSMGFGNSPAAKLLADAGLSSDASKEAIADALADFVGSHTYNNVSYDPAAWGDLQTVLNGNPDENPFAFVVSGSFRKNPQKLAALKNEVQALAQAFTARYSDGAVVHSADTFVTLQSISANTYSTMGGAIDLTSEEDFAAWVPEENTVYRLTYSFEDRRGDAALTGRTVEASRYVIVLSKIGDVNGDGNVNVADANALTNMLKESQTTGAAIALSDDFKPADTTQEDDASEAHSVAERFSVAVKSGGAPLSGYDSMYLYRICDVNHDGVVDDWDAAAIKARKAIPIQIYYDG